MRRYDGWLPCSLNKHKGLRGCIVACSCGAPLRRQDTRVHGAGGAPPASPGVVCAQGNGHGRQKWTGIHFCRQEYIPVDRNARECPFAHTLARPPSCKLSAA